MAKIVNMNTLYTFESYINKLNEGLIETYDIDKTIQDIKNIISTYNLSYSIIKLNNNTFKLNISEYNKIPHLKEIIEYLIDSIFNLYGWFPSTLEITNIFGFTNNIKFNKDYLLNPSNNLTDIIITFESKFDKVDKHIPKKLYHLSIQHYENDTLKNGLVPKSKSKLTSHDYDGRIYLCKSVGDCKILINPMNIFYSKEKDSIIYSGMNPKRVLKHLDNFIVRFIQIL